MKLNKFYKAVRKREALKLARHLESLGAAFCQQTQLSPSDTVLVSRDKEDGTREYFFTKREEKADLKELHPDIKLVSDNFFRFVEGPAHSADELLELKKFCEKYHEEK